MKKSILISSAILITFSLTAFGFMNLGAAKIEQKKTSCSKTAIVNPDFVNTSYSQIAPEFVYNVDTRFITTISKEKLDQAKSIIDILPTEETKTKEDYKNVRIAVLDKNKGKSIVGENEFLTLKQLKLLESTTYASNICIKSLCKNKNEVTGEMENYELVYYITIVPTQMAEFRDGNDALINYLKENSKDEIAIVTKDKLKFGQLNFTVTAKGTIAKVKLLSTSGYATIDERFVELIKNMPEKWNPAQNAKGQNVDQEFVFFFGLEGC